MQSQQPEFGRRLRERRTELGLSQRQLAGEFTTPSYISLLEAGRRSPTLDVLVHLARMLGMPVEQLSGQDVRGSSAQREDGTTAAVTQALVQSALEAGQYDQASDLLSTALESAQQKQDPHRVLEIGLQLQGLLQRIDRTLDRLALLGRLIDSDIVTTSPLLQATLYSDLAAARRDAGQLIPAREAAYTALGGVSSGDLSGSAQHVRALGILISILCELNELGQVEALVEELLELAKGCDGGTLARARWVASITAAQLGRHEAAYQHLLAARETLISPVTPLRDWLRFARSAANVLLAAGKDPDAARKWLEDAETAARTLDLPAERVKLAAARAWYEVMVGNPQRATELYAEICESGIVLPGPDQVRAQLTQCEALEALGRREEAAELLRSTAGLCEDSGAYRIAVQIWKKIDQLHVR